MPRLVKELNVGRPLSNAQSPSKISIPFIRGEQKAEMKEPPTLEICTVTDSFHYLRTRSP